jgi:hypothetical protein
VGPRNVLEISRREKLLASTGKRTTLPWTSISLPCHNTHYANPAVNKTNLGNEIRRKKLGLKIVWRKGKRK